MRCISWRSGNRDEFETGKIEMGEFLVFWVMNGLPLGEWGCEKGENTRDLRRLNLISMSGCIVSEGV